MLIQSDRHTDRDLAHWRGREREDALLARSRRLESLITSARRTVTDFARAGRCYAGVSWGKDSTVLAHLVVLTEPGVPLIWVRVEPIANPDCVMVRDAFLNTHRGARYEEIAVEATPDPVRGHRATGTLERGFAEAEERHGHRHLSGVRADESGVRAARDRRWGTTSPNTCAPLSRWTATDVFAYLHLYKLPVHPAYAMTQGGTWPRETIRVASLGGERGRGFGRREWERLYYGPELRRLGLAGVAV